MRVISGSLGGRQFDAPTGAKTHPMSEKIRGAIFNALGDISDLTVLDAFAGSGGLSFEAISHGAQSALMIEKDRRAQSVISKNIDTLGLNSQLKLVKAGAASWLDTTDQRFELILLDPPYDQPQLGLLQRLANRCQPSGLVVVSLPPEIDFELTGFELLSSKNYGDAQLLFFRNLIKII